MSSSSDDANANNNSNYAVRGSLYLPDFYQEYHDFEMHPPDAATATMLGEKQWLTEELVDELKVHCFQATPEHPKPTAAALTAACKAFFYGGTSHRK